MNKNKFDYNFDLNIGERYLSDWPDYFAVREIIANALDATIGGKIEIYKEKDGVWIIQDCGEGLQPTNLIFEEGQKKGLENKIGKFGVGLKDALGVLYSRGIQVEIITSEYNFKFNYEQKDACLGHKTLHAYILKEQSSTQGTKVILINCDDMIMKNAEQEFIIFKDPKKLEITEYGEILERTDSAIIYLNGIKIADEKTLRYSYNITKSTNSLKSKINRERNYVSRNAFRDNLVKIIEIAKKDEVFSGYFKDLSNSSDGNCFTEIDWTSTLVAVCNWAIKKKRKFVVLSNNDIEKYRERYNSIKQIKEIEIVRVRQAYIDKLQQKKKGLYKTDIFFSNFQLPYKEVQFDDLSESEKNVLNKSIEIFRTIPAIKYNLLSNIIISDFDTNPIYNNEERITIKRISLNSISSCSINILNALSSINKSGETDFKDYVLGEICLRLSDKI